MSSGSEKGSFLYFLLSSPLAWLFWPVFAALNCVCWQRLSGVFLSSCSDFQNQMCRSKAQEDRSLVHYVKRCLNILWIYWWYYVPCIIKSLSNLASRIVVELFAHPVIHRGADASPSLPLRGFLALFDNRSCYWPYANIIN